MDGAGAGGVPVRDKVLHIAADQIALERPSILSLLRAHRANQSVVVGNESFERATQLSRVCRKRQGHRSGRQRVQEREANAWNDVADGIAGLDDWIRNPAETEA